jgi:hypothetical protein
MQNFPNGWPDALWIVRRLGNAGILRARTSQPMVRSRLCRRVRPRIAVRISSRCVAFWDSGSYLVCGCRAAMVAERGSEMKSTAMENLPIACTLIEGDFRDRLAWIAELTRDALQGYERADLTLKLRYAREAVQRVQDMVRKERACCAFLTFEMREQADEVWVTIKAPEEIRPTADALFEPFLPR